MDFARPDAVEAFLHLHVYKELQEAGVHGATVCVAKLGRYSFTISNCYGFADAARGVVLDSRTSLFDLGGCAKVLAALALLQLLQESGLTVATGIAALLPPGLKVDTSRHGPVTVLHLLTHTSGLQRGGGGGGGGGGEAGEGGMGAAGGSGGGNEGGQPIPSSVAAVAERGETPVMSYLLAEEVYGVKPPGLYRPQDIDYMLIGAIIENLTGEPYDSYIKDVLLDPLGVRLPPQPRDPRAGADTDGGGGGAATTTAAAAAAAAVEARPTDGTGGNSAAVLMYVGQQAMERARAQGAAPAGLTPCGGGGGGGPGSSAVAEALSSLAPAVQKVLARYPPPPLTPVGGLVLSAADIARLLPLFLHNAAAAGGDLEAAGSGVIGRSLLQSLYEIRMYDFIKDVGVAYGGLVSLGLGHCGDRVVCCESPPPPPSTREAALTAQAAQAALLNAQQPLQPPQLQLPQPPQPPGVGDGQEQPEEGQEPGRERGQEEQQEQHMGEDGQLWAAAAAAASGAANGGGCGSGGEEGGGGGRCGGGGCVGHPSLLLVAPEAGLAMVVSCNTAGPEGAAFCRRVASRLLERYRPSELPRPLVRSWLAAVPPPRHDAMTHLVAFPPACCLNPTTYFDGWPVTLPDYIKVHCVQAPGHGSRRHEASEARLARLVAPAATALLAGLPADAPLALFGHGLGALWAFEVARRLECLYQRPLLHLFVCAAAAPGCFPPRGGGTGGSGGGDADAERSGGPPKRFETWRIPESQQSRPPQPQQQPAEGQAQPPPAAATAVPAAVEDGPELYELPDEVFITACRNHPRFPKQLRHDIKAILDHLPLLRADIEAEARYTYVPPAPSLCPSVAAVLASVQNRADEEARISQGLLSCPITVLTPENETALGPQQTAGWEQVTSGVVRFQSVSGDYHCLEERRTRGQVVAAIAGALGRQMSVHTPWLAKLRPDRAGGRWAGAAGRPAGVSRPSSAVGSGGGGGSGVAGPVLTLHLPPVYPRG